MGLSRRFLNMIVNSDEAFTRSLRRIDLKRLQLFYPTTPPPPPPPPAPMRQPTTTTERVQLPCGGPFFTTERTRLPVPVLNYETIRLPGPILKLKPHSYRQYDMCGLACYPFGQRKVLTTDQAGRNFLYDVETRDVAAMPVFHTPRLRRHRYISLFVPSGDGGSLYLMVKDLKEVRRYEIEVGQPSMDFEVMFYGNGRTTSNCKLLPLPPFVLKPISPNERPEIRSYAIVGGGSQICVSVDGRGTYTLDTASHTWDKIGVWTLPFHGNVEYVPELKLWFGLSGDAQHLAAADLSIMDAYSPPQLVAGHGWEEFKPPEEWAEWAQQGLEVEIYQEDAQLMNLGSGRFCIARFFIDWRPNDDTCYHFVVLTGVEVVERVLDNGEVKLEMIPHKSMCHHKSLVDGTNIEQLF